MNKLSMKSVCVAVVMGLLGVSAEAGVKKINVQGKLTNSTGTPLAGTQTVTFRLYKNISDAISAAVWTESQSVALATGQFNVALGQVASLDALPFDKPYYLGIQVAGDTAEMTPRQLLGSSAYSFGSVGTFVTASSAVVNGTLEVRNNTSPQLVIGHVTFPDYRLTVTHSGTFDMPYGNANYNFRIAGADRLFLGNNGNSGFGTATPNEKLGIAAPDAKLRFTDQAGGTSQSGFVFHDGGSTRFNLFANYADGSLDLDSLAPSDGWSIRLRTTPSSGGAPVSRLIVNGAGNVGIGTNAPTGKLDVRGDTTPQLVVGHLSSPTSRVTLSHNGTFDMPGGSANYIFRIQGQQRLFIGNNGRIGIGTADPNAVLDVAGNLNFDGQKICSVVVAGNWRSDLFVPQEWTPAVCDSYRASTAATSYQLGCVFKKSFSLGTSGGGIPSPNCGW